MLLEQQPGRAAGDQAHPGQGADPLGGDLPVAMPVGLTAGRAHGRALARVQDAELDASLVGDLAHQAAERVDLTHDLSLAETADRRVAAHLPDLVEVEAAQGHAHPESRRGGGRLDAGVPAANDEHVEVVVPVR